MVKNQTIQTIFASFALWYEKKINNELVLTPYELTLPEFVSVRFSSLFFSCYRIIDKSHAINLRLSAFICGLKKSYNSSQSNFSFVVNLWLIKNYTSVSIIRCEFFCLEKDGVAIG